MLERSSEELPSVDQKVGRSHENDTVMNTQKVEKETES